MPPHKKKQPSALALNVLDQLDRLRDARDTTQADMMRAAGSTQQAWSRWTKGASPRLDLLEAVARALDAELVVNVLDRRVKALPPPRGVSLGVTAEAAEIAALVDTFKDDSIRIYIREAVYRLADHFAAKAQPESPRQLEAKNPAHKAKKPHT